MVFCNNALLFGFKIAKKCHNPYFNRWFSAIAAKISQNFTFLCKKLVFSDSFCELYFTQPLYINYCTNYLNNFLLIAKIMDKLNSKINFNDKKMSYEDIILYQGRLLGKYLTGDEKNYVGFSRRW